MDFKAYLKAKGLTDEQITAIVDGMKAEKIYLSSEENIDERYLKLKTQKEDAEKELKTASDTIVELKKGTVGQEELQAKITQYEQDMAKLKSDSSKQLFDSALETELIKLNVHSTKAARAELDLEKVKYENGQFAGLKEQTETWGKEKAFLIKTGQTKTNYNPTDGDSNATSTAAIIAAQRNAGTAQQSDNPYANAWGTK